MTELLPEYENVAAATARAERIRQSGHGLFIPLTDREGFWSRGWRGCEFCGNRVDDWTLPLHPFHERRGKERRRGWRCT